MSEAKRARVVAAIRAINARVAYLGISRAVNPPICENKGLLALGFVLDSLARRHLDEAESGMVLMGALEAGREKASREQAAVSWLQPTDAEMPDPAMLRRYGWYVGYASRFHELIHAAQQAVRGGALRIRSIETGVVLESDPGLVAWLAMDLAAGERSCNLPTACADWPPASQAWPDNLPVPIGGVRPVDAEAWASSSGITQPGELIALLGGGHGGPKPQPVAPVLALVRDAGPAPATGPGWTPERLAKRQAELRGQGVRNHTQRLAAESGIDEREIRRQIENWRKSGPLGAIASQLSK